MSSSTSDIIFGTPSEPLFNNELHSVSSDMLQDWLVSVAKRNISDIKDAKETEVIVHTNILLILTCSDTK